MDYSAMTKEEREATLRRLQDDLEDLEETIHFNLTFSSAHIGGGQVRKDEETLADIRGRIAHVRRLLEDAGMQVNTNEGGITI